MAFCSFPEGEETIRPSVVAVAVEVGGSLWKVFLITAVGGKMVCSERLSVTIVCSVWEKGR